MKTIAQDSPRKRITPVDAVHIAEVVKAIIDRAIEASERRANGEEQPDQAEAEGYPCEDLRGHWTAPEFCGSEGVTLPLTAYAGDASP